ncbi:MAG: hypothetical protein QHH06_08435 [Clostridiales bacterium]|jgi:hypothetical protein|nr:hypothetical protein [Eubacteriales bacterium]MDH7566495.1 hypothetical protein [Clostridiales bacterium]
MIRKRFVIIAIILVGVGATGVFAFNRLFDLFFLSQLQSMGVELKPGKDGQEQVITIQLPVEDSQTPDGREAPEGEGDKTPGGAGKAGAKAREDGGEKEQLPGTGPLDAGSGDGPSGQGNAAGGKRTVTVTKDRIQELEKKVSAVDKARVMAIVSARLKPSDIAMLQGSFEGEVNLSKIGLAKELLKNRVTKEEKEELKRIFYKYIALLSEGHQ